MKIGDVYICQVGCAGQDFGYSEEEEITIDKRNINWCESLERAGHIKKSAIEVVEPVKVEKKSSKKEMKVIEVVTETPTESVPMLNIQPPQE